MTEKKRKAKNPWDRKLSPGFVRKTPDQLITEWTALIDEVEATIAKVRG